MSDTDAPEVVGDQGDKPEADQGDSPKKTKPSTWWQWVLVYPALALALISAVPDWMEHGKELYREFRGMDAETELVRFFQTNDECVRSPVQYYQAITNTKVDGTICKSTGDVFLRIQTPQGETVYKGIFVQDIISSKFASVGGDLGLVRSAQAATARPAMSYPAAGYAQTVGLSLPDPGQFSIVVCQAVSGSYIIRHLKEGSVCYDEKIDASSGVVVSKDQVSCRTSC